MALWPLIPRMRDFYPRPPRGGRLHVGRCNRRVCQISIHALREEGDEHPLTPIHRARTISIHALREEGDLSTFFVSLVVIQFLSTPSARRATRTPQPFSQSGGISIHALREEGDKIHVLYLLKYNNFYPRPPRGGRLCKSSELLHFCI